MQDDIENFGPDTVADTTIGTEVSDPGATDNNAVHAGELQTVDAGADDSTKHANAASNYSAEEEATYQANLLRRDAENRRAQSLHLSCISFGGIVASTQEITTRADELAAYLAGPVVH